MSTRTFEELAAERRTLKAFCLFHHSSVMYFSAGTSFYLNQEEDPIKPRDLRHITSTATCYASLLECPIAFRNASMPVERIYPEKLDEDIDQLSIEGKATEFARGILQQKLEEWISDDSARVYCECRALPFAIQMADKWYPSIEEHLRHAMRQLELEPGRAAIGEADPKVSKDQWYPPNAYHTYWLLKALRSLKARFPARYVRLEKSLSLQLRIDRMIEWARQMLAYQVSLHTADSSTLDSDQLAWSLATICGDPLFNETKLEEQDFIREALKCLFATQTRVGTWRHYAPLFHYKKTGNAYCYIFETFAALLEEALRPGEHFLRHALKSHCSELTRLWSYARTTQRPHPKDNSVLMWSSGHRMNQNHPESWATASVFQYAQALRRLIGIWTREEAEKQLPSVTTDIPQPQARLNLVKRSATWTLGEGLADRFFTLFIHPRALGTSETSNDPDNRPIGENYARSAILYGPPGASKTTMVRNLAASIGWRYVELHSSHFVAEGLPMVQRTADEIFKRLYELDHAVILFDEIDELVREREKEDEASGRFLTTSMLPKLAELWSNGKVIYFVATNHIEFFDKAIARAQRFDAVWFVSPPSFESKIARLKELLNDRLKKDVSFSFTKDQIEEAFDNAVFRAQNLPPRADSDELGDSEILAKFKLLRFDELSELVARICPRVGANSRVDTDMLKESLRDLKDGRWRTLLEYSKFEDDQKYQRRDYGKLNLWRVSRDQNLPRSLGLVDAAGEKYLAAAAENVDEISIPDVKVSRTGVGSVSLERISTKKTKPRKKRRSLPKAKARFKSRK